MDSKQTHDNKLFKDSEQITEDLKVPSNSEVSVNIKKLYDPEFHKNLNRLRFLIAEKEYSQRGFELSGAIIAEMKNHYAAWVYRREFLQANKSEKRLLSELEFCTKVIFDEPKGFQSWEHRRFCITELARADYDQEIGFISQILGLDAKNYHAWAYRVWLVSKFNWFAAEMPLIDQLLANQGENNSVWSYRKFISRHLKLTIEEEEKLAFSFLSKNPKIESAWYYLDDLYEPSRLFSQKLKDFCLSLESEKKENRFSLAALIFNELKQEASLKDFGLIEKAIQQLMQKFDPMRKEYWIYFKQNFVDLTSK